MTSQTLLHEALQLPESDRADLVAELLRSLAPAPDVADDVETAWTDELSARASKALSSDSELAPWTTVKQRVEARLAQ